MKKIAFALQVFTLTALLPVCVILEMNHTKDSNKEKDNVEIVSGKVKTISTAYAQVPISKIKM